jgi:hypothetical protein
LRWRSCERRWAAAADSAFLCQRGLDERLDLFELEGFGHKQIRPRRQRTPLDFGVR